jgi:hypothetical protein
VGVRLVCPWVGVAAPLALATAVAACQPPVISSAVPTSPGQAPISLRPVMLSSLTVPPNARELGVVQAHSDQADISRLMPEFVSRVAGLGGNFGKIDDITTSYEMRSVTSTQSYSCGTASAPRSCSRVVTSVVEVPTTRVLGRAFEVQ